MSNLEQRRTSPQASIGQDAASKELGLEYATPDGIRATREALGLSQAQLAEVIGRHAMTVSKWERGALRVRPYDAALLFYFHCAAKKLNGRTCAETLAQYGPVSMLAKLLRIGGSTW
jgi:DNA-binding transcriptional regulator YiaG